MCACLEPNTNGTPGYSWDGKNVSTRQVDPPPLEDRDVLLFDEPGRCGGLDCHSHHFRLVNNCGPILLVKHGGGTERLRVSLPGGKRSTFSFEAMSSDTRYWIFHAIYYAAHKAKRDGENKAAAEYRNAFTEDLNDKR